MTIYIHNPPEPNGVPTQPMPDARDEDRYYFTLFDMFTQGRCGYCAACPKIWHLNLPIITPGSGGGNPGADNWFGNYYLFKTPFYQTGLNGGTPGAPNVPTCQWNQRRGEPISGANNYEPPGSSPVYAGWQLVFEWNNDRGYRWALYSPHEPSEYPCRWEFVGDPFNDFRCLRPNVFRLFNLNNTNFPYRGTNLTITPFHP